MKKLKIFYFTLLASALLLGLFSSMVAQAADSSYKWVDANNIDSTNNNSTVTYTYFKKDGDTYKYVYSQPIAQAGNNSLNICYQISVTAKSGKAQLFFRTDPLLDCKTAEYYASNSKNITIDGELPTKIKNNKDLNVGDTNPVDCDANPDDARCKDEQPADKSTEEQCSQALSPFGWILCPATDFADKLYDLFKQLVNNLLFFESDKYNDNGLYDSWRIMVTLANTVLVLVAIVMIAAQIFNFEFISAYTVKKALPRIVVAAILIQLSWFMVTTGVQLVNAIGSGIYWLLVAPFTRNIDPGGSSGVLEIGPILAQGGANGSEAANAGMFVFASGALATGALLAFASGLWMTMVVAAIGVVISILVAIVTLILREALLIVLIALAPLAIAFWILPGTNGLWSMWWKTFSRLLLMYPLIMLLFAGGTISAILLASAGDNINKIFAIVAYFIPVFLISTTYKFAGGAFASMANFTSKMGDKAKGSSLFGMRDTAKRKREESPLSLARAARKEQHRIDAQKKFADRLGSDSLYGKGLRRASGGGNANTIVARA